MKVKFKDKEFSICPALAIIVCNLVSYCDEHNLPFSVYRSDENMLEFITDRWSEQLKFKYQHHIKRDYSDLALVKYQICTLMESSIKIVVNKNANTNKYRKE